MPGASEQVRGLPRSKQRCPPGSTTTTVRASEEGVNASTAASTATGRVVIGMDPHKRSATIEVMTADESIVGGGRFATDGDGYAEMLRYTRRWADRVWAIE